MRITPSANDFGAVVEGVDLTRPLDAETVASIRQAWLAYQVISIPGQPLEHADLERFTRYLGDYGHDPYVKPLDDHPHVLEIRREPNEQASPFGSAWHSDWSFQATPPAATILHAKVVPPVGGDTLYADGYRAFEDLDAGMQARLESLTAIHSARRPYSKQGFLAGGGDKRSMTILPSDAALATQEHPVVRTHPETGRKALWVNAVYTIGIRDMDEGAAHALLKDLCAHATQEKYLHRVKWTPGMLTIWDNRSVQHCAQGGYDGYQRIMHRTTVAGDMPY